MAKRINSRRKGANGELLLSKFLQERGHDARRSQQFCGRGGESADLISKSLSNLHIECKCVEKLNTYEALARAQGDASVGKIPIVFHKRNNKGWVVILTAEEFLKIFDNAKAGQPE